MLQLPPDRHGAAPVLSWADEIEPSALAQVRNVARLPFLFRHVAVMPDVHWGKGATVGTVIATQGAVVPAAVGVDIGCGMMAVKTALPHERVLERLKDLRAGIEAAIPVGFQGNERLTPPVEAWAGWGRVPERIDRRLLDKARHQLGSLGGGNHFIEICLDADEAVWVLLHSGSRNVGKTLADLHIRKAKGLMTELAIGLPDPDLAYFLERMPEYHAYLEDLHWCQDYALENRREMMRRILELLAALFTEGRPLARLLEVNCHHNYAALETHFGRRVLVTRKGAVRAQAGDLGIIPGSMGARSYIVRGLGNAESFCSCAHGAGRRMSRNAAKRRFHLSDLAFQTQGVECRKDKGVLDEIPAAYKDIDTVMAQQADLVEVLAVLKQVVCVKG